MKTITNLLASLILAVAVGAIAILSVQNATSVSLKFLFLQSIEMPMGVLLAFSAGAGAIGGAIAPLFSQSDNKQTQLEDTRSDNEEDF